MLVNEKIKATIKSEIKSLQALLKSLESREVNYKVDLSKAKQEITDSLSYYAQILEEKPYVK